MPAVNREYPDHIIEVVLKDPGRESTYTGRNGPETALLERVFEVTLDGDPIGTVSHTLVNRAHYTPKRMYVSKWWKSPAWVPQGIGTGSSDYPSRVKAVRALIDATLERRRKNGQ